MFEFKQFTVRQDRTAMKVGTDGVLIGAWAAVERDDRYILDIGAGTGLIALMMAQRSLAYVDAVEIDGDAAAQAAENIEQSKWSQRVKIHDVDISDFTNNIKYDSIVSNPPFFINSLRSPSEGRTTARHTASLSFANLILSVERLLSESGRFSLILPAAESELFDKESQERLYLWRRCCVKSRRDSDCIRVMSEYRLSKPIAVDYSEIAIREADSNDYTSEYRELTADFYLKF